MPLYYETPKSRLFRSDKFIPKIYLLNLLDNLVPIIKPLYPDFNRPTKNQQGIFRSLLLMRDLHNYSLTNWANAIALSPTSFWYLRIHWFYTTLVSYYVFLLRLWRAGHKLHLKRKLRTGRFTSRPKLRLKSVQKLSPKRSWLIKPSTVSSEISVLSSSCKGMLAVPLTLHICCKNDFSVAFEDSPYSGASYYGVKVCDCRPTAQEAFQALMPDGAGTVIGSSGSSDTHSLMWLLLIVLTTFPFIPKWFKPARHNSITIVFALDNIPKLYLICVLKTSLPMEPWTIILFMTFCHACLLCLSFGYPLVTICGFQGPPPKFTLALVYDPNYPSVKFPATFLITLYKVC